MPPRSRYAQLGLVLWMVLRGESRGNALQARGQVQRRGVQSSPYVICTRGGVWQAHMYIDSRPIRSGLGDLPRGLLEVKTFFKW